MRFGDGYTDTTVTKLPCISRQYCGSQISSQPIWKLVHLNRRSKGTATYIQIAGLGTSRPARFLKTLYQTCPHINVSEIAHYNAKRA